jgi:hypothetical protein
LTERTPTRERDRLSVTGGLAALSLDAMASVAYGPEAIVIVLAAGGGAALGLTVPVTLAIALLLGVLTLSYRQVIAVFPEGGGAYGVAKAQLGRRASLVAAASLVVDYVLNVAVSVAAGVAALTSAAPWLLPYTFWLCLGVLALLLSLRACANGCAALTGVEAIANAVPSFRRPRVRRAQRAEVALGGLLGIMLIGVAALIVRFGVRPAGGVTVLSQVTAASLGHGAGYYVVQAATVVLLALAANTSFGGMPVLARLLAEDNNLPHLFALRAERQVHRYGIGFLAVTGALLLIGTDGDMNTLVPLFAIGVFVGFTLSQAGMVRHWWTGRPPGWRPRAALNAFGALLTGLAAIVVTVTKFPEGGWLIVVTMPLLVALMSAVERGGAASSSRS